MLDLFCFTGGFSLERRQHGGATALSGSTARRPRSSWPGSTPRSTGSIALGSRKATCFEVLERLCAAKASASAWSSATRPSSPRRPSDVERALKGYLRLNLAALDVLEPDGVLVDCSCSGLVGRELFADVIASAAEQSGRPIQILEQRGQAPDHPISASCLETEYLKCMICRAGGW